jgi:hypothetical protein
VGFAELTTIPYVLATDVVRVAPASRFRSRRSRVRSRRGSGARRAARCRVPLLPRAVSEQLVASFARKNGIAGGRGLDPGARTCRCSR